MGSPTRIHDVLPEVLHSPMVAQFGFSPLVRRAYAKNARFFAPTLEMEHALQEDAGIRPHPSASWRNIFTRKTDPDSSTRIKDIIHSASPGTVNLHLPLRAMPVMPMLAVHVRRGDYEQHCKNLFAWSSSYSGFNTQSGLVDRFMDGSESIIVYIIWNIFAEYL